MRSKRAAKNDGNRGRTAACYVILYNSYYIGLHGYNANDLAQNVSNSTVIEHGMTMSCEAIDRMEHFQYFGPLKVRNSVFSYFWARCVIWVRGQYDTMTAHVRITCSQTDEQSVSL